MLPCSLILPMVFVALVLPLGPALADTLDVFPISEGFQYTYVYWDSVIGNGHFGDINYSQMGTISYRIEHAVPITESLIEWEITEYRDLYRTDYALGSSDTTLDTTLYYLNESTTGMHALRGGAYLWRFPVHSGTFMPEITDTVFRYSEVSPAIFRFESHCSSPRAYFDSLWFRVDSGLTQWHWENCIDDDMFVGEVFGTAQLVSLIVTSVDEHVSRPSRTRLITNYPNPFNGTTTIAYDLENATAVILKVYDMNGRLILSVDEGYQYPGNHSIQIKETNLSSGVYLVRLETGDGTQAGRMVYLR